MVPTILTWLFIIALDPVQPTPVASPPDLTALRTGRGLLRRAIGGVEISGKGGEHGSDTKCSEGEVSECHELPQKSIEEPRGGGEKEASKWTKEGPKPEVPP